MKVEIVHSCQWDGEILMEGDTPEVGEKAAKYLLGMKLAKPYTAPEPSAQAEEPIQTLKRKGK
jgi:hypothetical protein